MNCCFKINLFSGTISCKTHIVDKSVEGHKSAKSSIFVSISNEIFKLKRTYDILNMILKFFLDLYTYNIIDLQLEYIISSFFLKFKAD